MEAESVRSCQEAQNLHSHLCSFVFVCFAVKIVHDVHHPVNFNMKFWNLSLMQPDTACKANIKSFSYSDCIAANKEILLVPLLARPFARSIPFVFLGA